MSLAILILLAFLLDSLFGDPSFLPHPVRLIGWLATRAEQCRRLPFNLYIAGFIAVLVVLGVSGGFCYLLLHFTANWPILTNIIALYILYSSIAARDLAWHAKRIAKAIRLKDLPLARQRLAMIVGRDTENLDEEAVCRGAIESVAENIVDGVTAPLFWAAIFGPLGAIIYKAINTMDSMFGYKNERYLKFGMVAARLDDLANFIPARLTAIFIIMAAFILRYNGIDAARIWQRDHNCHKSPNSGHSEAAVAGALGLQFGGANKYFGEIVEKPTIGDFNKPCQADDIFKAIRLMYTCVIIFIVCLVLVIL